MTEGNQTLVAKIIPQEGIITRNSNEIHRDYYKNLYNNRLKNK